MDYLKKILTPEKAAKWSAKSQTKGSKVVFTNGCFDILHAGHAQYLYQAKNKGDLLIIALDTDESVRALKGEGRPINSLEDRMKVIAALGFVDAVTWFEGSNPLPLIKKIKPNILVKGGDWKIPQILGSKEVLAWGGKVFSLSFLKGRSTTNVIKKIQETKDTK